MIELIEWLVLIASLPSQNKASRMRLWRAVKGLGCASLRDGVYLLPLRDTTGTALRTLADEVRSAGGEADVLHVAANGAQDEAFRRMFDRSADYAALLQAIHTADAGEPKTLRTLRRNFSALAASDYFPGEARRQAEEALTALEAAVTGEPRDGTGTIRRLASADFSGRTWATRQHLWVDRMASAWLIRRFIDPQATFLWLANPQHCPEKVLGFDFDGATFTHIDGRVTFEVLATSFELDADPALTRIATLVHCLDVGGVPVPEAAGIEVVLAGARATAPDDDALLAEASRLFDNLYTNYRQENKNA